MILSILILFFPKDIKKEQPNHKYINIFWGFLSLLFFSILFPKILSKSVSRKRCHHCLQSVKNEYSELRVLSISQGKQNRYSNKSMHILYSSWMQANNCNVFCWGFKLCSYFETCNKQHLPQDGQYSGRRHKRAKPPREYVGSMWVKYWLDFLEREERMRTCIFLLSS